MTLNVLVMSKVSVRKTLASFTRALSATDDRMLPPVKAGRLVADGASPLAVKPYSRLGMTIVWKLMSRANRVSWP